MCVLSGIRAHGLSNPAVSDLCLMLYGHWSQVINYRGLGFNIVDYHLSFISWRLCSGGVLCEYCGSPSYVVDVA